MLSYKMIKNTFLLFILGALLVACGGQQQPTTLEGKKKLLQEKKSALLTLNKEIEELQSEIQDLDPSLKNQVKSIPVSTTTLRPGNFQHFVKDHE